MLFALTIQSYGLPKPEKEFKFHPVKKWRFDYAIVEKKIAIECEGGTWVNGRHNRGMGFINDMNKYNTAVSMGWKILRFTPQQLNKIETLELIKKTFEL